MEVRRIALEKFERAAGKHHAKAEGHVAWIPLDDLYLPARMAAPEQQAEEKTGRTGADDACTFVHEDRTRGRS